jgi:hypothetical protein
LFECAAFEHFNAVDGHGSPEVARVNAVAV